MNARLAISRLVVRCRAPRESTRIAASAERAARGGLAEACARAASGSAARATGIVRIRRLHVRLRLQSDVVDETLLCHRWSEAIVRALGIALERGSDAGLEVVRASSASAWRARFLGAHLDGQAIGRWEFEEFSDIATLDPAAAAILLLSESPAESAHLLDALDADANLVRLLVQLDAEGVAHVLALIQGDAPPEADPAAALLVAEAIGGPSRHDIIALAASPRSTGDAAAIAGRIAILLHARGRIGHRPGFASPAEILAGLTTLGAIVRRLALPSLDSGTTPALADGIGGWPRPTPTFATLLGTSPPGRLEGSLAAWSAVPPERLATLIAGARPIALLASSPEPGPSVAIAAEPPRRITTEAAGLFLLIPSVRALGWDESLRGDGLHPTEADRRRRHLLAALAQQVTTGFDPDCEGLDPGLALFAGFGPDPDIADFRRFYRETGIFEGCDSSADLAGDRPDGWPAYLEQLAAQLFDDLRVRIRPLRDASDEFLRERVVATTGRLLVRPREVHVLIGGDPYHIALHHAGCDAPCPSVAWLGGRDVTFRLEGLS